MIKTFVFLLFLTNPAYSMPTCNLELDSKIIILNPKKITNKIFKNGSDCPDNIMDNFRKFIPRSNGSLNNESINKGEHFKPYRVNLIPEYIQVLNVSKMLNNSNELSKNLKWKNIKAISRKGFYLANQSSNFEYSYREGLNPGKKKNVTININNPFSQSTKKIQIIADLLVKQTVFKAKNKIRTHSDKLDKNLFYKTTEYTHFADAVSDIGTIRFKKLNKTIKKGHTLRIKDLVQDYLVRPGQPVTAIFKSNKLNVQIKARALKSGKLGEFIYVENTRSKSKIIGKVIDYNKVEIGI